MPLIKKDFWSGLVLIPLLTLAVSGCKHTIEPPLPGSNVPPNEVVAFPAEKTPQGQPIGNAVTQTIGPSGGSITLPDQGLTLHFPAGALDQNTPIQVQLVENKAIGGVGPAIQLEPRATTLNKPIELIWHYTQKSINGTSADAIGLAQQQNNGEWFGRLNLTVDQLKQTLTTVWPGKKLDRPVAYYAQYYLKYDRDQVVVNQPVAIIVAFQPNHRDEIEALERQTPLAALVPWKPVDGSQLDNWLINGEDPLNQTSERPGQLSVIGDGEKATYFAPNRVPPSKYNPVAISVELKTGSRRQVILVANFEVIGGNTMIVNGANYENPQTDVSSAWEGKYLFISLSEGDPRDPNHPAILHATIENYHGPGTYAMGEKINEIYGQNSEEEGKMWSRSYHQNHEPYGTVYGQGSITITAHDSRTGIITGRINAGLYYQPDRSKDPESGSVSGTFRTIVR